MEFTLQLRELAVSTVTAEVPTGNREEEFVCLFTVKGMPSSCEDVCEVKSSSVIFNYVAARRRRTQGRFYFYKKTNYQILITDHILEI